MRRPPSVVSICCEREGVNLKMIGLFVRTARFSGQWVAARLNIKSERGATAVEYGLMVALIAAVIIAAVVFLGQETSNTFQCTAESIEGATAAC